LNRHRAEQSGFNERIVFLPKPITAKGKPTGRARLTFLHPLRPRLEGATGQVLTNQRCSAPTPWRSNANRHFPASETIGASPAWGGAVFAISDDSAPATEGVVGSSASKRTVRIWVGFICPRYEVALRNALSSKLHFAPLRRPDSLAALPRPSRALLERRWRFRQPRLRSKTSKTSAFPSATWERGKTSVAQPRRPGDPMQTAISRPARRSVLRQRGAGLFLR